MISLIRNNVVKIVASEEEAKRLQALGFKIEAIAVVVEDEPPKGDENIKTNENETPTLETLTPETPTPETPTPETVLFICPLCGKEYKTKKGLGEHIAKAHGGDDHGGADEQIDSRADAGAEADQ